jgi:hypothetical protein
VTRCDRPRPRPRRERGLYVQARGAWTWTDGHHAASRRARQLPRTPQSHAERLSDPNPHP